MSDAQLETKKPNSKRPDSKRNVGRREFLKTTAAITGGLCIAAYVPELGPGARELAAAGAGVFAPNAFVRIAPDDTVTVNANHSKMGQSIYNRLPMLINEEIEADCSRIKVEAAAVDAAYTHTAFGVQTTGGTTTTPSE